MHAIEDIGTEHGAIVVFNSGVGAPASGDHVSGSVAHVCAVSPE